MSNLYRRPYIDASCQLSIHLAKWFQRISLEIDQPKIRIANGGRDLKNVNSCQNGSSEIS
jgi:hypothetical protein